MLAIVPNFTCSILFSLHNTPMRWIQSLLALANEKINAQVLDSLFMVTGTAGGRASIPLRLSDALDHSFINLPTIWFPNNPPAFFTRN